MIIKYNRLLSRDNIINSIHMFIILLMHNIKSKILFIDFVTHFICRLYRDSYEPGLFINLNSSIEIFIEKNP